MDAADVLAEARRLIEERGWWDGTPQTVRGEGGLSVCAMTALMDAARGRYLSDEFTEACLAVEAEAGIRHIPTWNDSSSAEDVLLTMKRAEERLRSAGGPVEHPVPPSLAGVDSRTAGSTRPRGRST